MGKASQRKRDRRENGGTMEELAAAARASKRRPFPVFWAVLGVLVVGGIVALVVTGTKTKSTAERAAASARVFSKITVTGDRLPTHRSTGTDTAVGTKLPTITGTGFDDVKRTLSADAGVPQVVLVVAHWCPHCRRELPRLTKWYADTKLASGALPGGLKVTTIATASSQSQANYPPAAWFANERWPFDTIADDQAGTAADQLGLDGFPYILFVKADGTIAQRTSGELTITDFAADVRAITPK
jgi:thiol-disulfide isomerase/thioredoxin